MTTSLFEELDGLPAPPEKSPVEDMFAQGVTEDETPRRTRPRRGRPPKPRPIDPDTGEEIEPPKRTYVRRDTKLNDDLVESLAKVASDVSPMLPTVAGVLVARADQTANGLMALAAGKPRVTAALRKAAGFAQIGELVTTAMLIVVAAMVDLGRLDPGSIILDNLGFADFIKDEKGRLRKDERGIALKDQTTLRDIYNTMHPEPPPRDDVPQGAPHWAGPSPDTGTGPTRMAPANWIPK